MCKAGFAGDDAPRAVFREYPTLAPLPPNVCPLPPTARDRWMAFDERSHSNVR